MTSRNDTSSVQAMMTAIALSALGLTTTFNTSGMTYTVPHLAVMDNLSENNDIETTTPSPQMIKTDNRTGNECAEELFGCDMRDLTKEEAGLYKAALKKIYKPTGVNIFDIC